MTYELQPCSPKAKDKIDWEWAANNLTKPPENVGTPTEGAYPFERMHFADCFIVPFDKTVEKTIRNRVSSQNKVDERRYVVIKHTEFECYEVARVK